MRAGSWYADPAAPACAHGETAGAVLDLHGEGEVPAERCLGCRAVRSLSPRVELRVAYRAEPLAFNKVAFPDEVEKEKPRWTRPSFVPESWWNGPRYA